MLRTSTADRNPIFASNPATPLPGAANKEDVMERPVHNLSNLFAQLGHANDEASIARFIDTHSPLADGIQLYEAAFWTPAQAGFLRESILEDADWAEVIDELNNDLRARH